MTSLVTSLITIGHSNRSIEEFIALLHASNIEVVADVRKLKGSRKYPHFNEDVLKAELAQANIGYVWFEALSGRRPKSKDIAPEVNALWRNQSFHNYADYALSPQFADALTELIELAKTQTVAVMCAEAVWWRCHRRLIADHVIARGEAVTHVLGPGQAAPAQLTEGAVARDGGTVTYPPAEAE